MNYMRMHWFDLGLIFATAVGGFMLLFRPVGLALLLWLNLLALFLHQFEEYRYPGYFPGMMNAVMFHSSQPDRYPLNPQVALIINITVGWLSYFLAALFGAKLLWLGIAAILVSLGNFIAHTFLFNIRGHTRYNPGMIIAIFLFLPITVLFFLQVIHLHAASAVDWSVGIALGLVLNYIGILKMIDWLKDRNTSNAFPSRFLMPGTRKQG